MKKTAILRMIRTYAFLAASLVLVSCINDSVDGAVSSFQEKIGFSTVTASMSDDWGETKSNMIGTDVDSTEILETISSNEAIDTKGRIVSAVSTYGSFGAFAYVYPVTSGWSDAKNSAVPDFIYNLKFGTVGGQWRPDDNHEYYWPAPAYKLSFFAYSPYVDYEINGTPISDYMKISGKTATGAPVITYTTPDELEDQIDLMTASSEDIPGDYHQSVPLAFKHALSGIRFNARTAGNTIVIKNVTIANVYDNGTYAIGAAGWTAGSTKSSFTFPTDREVSGTSTVINDATDSLFFMVPQTLPEGAQLKVTYMFAGKENTATADFSGRKWEKGKIYTYNLTVNASAVYYEFAVTLADSDLEGNKATYDVVSRYVTDNGNGTPTYRNVDYSVSNLPSGASYVKNADGTLTITGPARTGNESLVTSNSAIVMRSVMDSLAGPVDLTTGANYVSDRRGETANCYVLNQAGYYCFPADVMGNGVDGIISTENPTSSWYGSSNENELYGTNGFFIDYNSSLLTNSAALPTSGCKAVLLWEDVDGLINDLKINNVGNGYISFKTMARSRMTPGNAVIALETSGGTIKWSWHIWCTVAPGTYTFASEVTGESETMALAGVSMAGDEGIPFATARYSYNSNGVVSSSAYTTKLMEVNLGTVERDRYYRFYPARQFDFTCTQSESGDARQLTVEQAKVAIGETPIGYTNTLYQWGRKDPFVSGDISTAAENTSASYYNSKHASGTSTFGSSGSTKNESDGLFGVYPVQDNDYVDYKKSGWSYSWNISSYAKNLMFAIQHPMTFIYNNYTYSSWSNETPADWFTYNNDVVSNDENNPGISLDLQKRYDNAMLWGCSYNWHDYVVSSGKTIYDPSPAGYKVPVARCYDTFIQSDGVYVYGNFTTNGLFFPATGVRNSATGKLENMGVRGDFWCSSLKYTLPGVDDGCYMKNAQGEFGHIYTDSDMHRGSALSIRPVGEDY